MLNPQANLIRLLVSAVTAVLFIVVVWATMAWTEQAGTERLRERAANNLSLYIANLRGELEKFQYLPASLAKSSELIDLLRHPDDPLRVQRINQLLFSINEVSGASDTYVMTRTGHTIAASNWDSDSSFVGRNFSFRPYFQDALQGRLGRYYALGTTSVKRGYYFAYPVRERDHAIGVVVVKVNLTAAEQDWGAGMTEYLVTDPDGIVFLSTLPGWKLHSLNPILPDTLDDIRVSRRYNAQNIEYLPLRVMQTVSADTRVVRIPEEAFGEREETWARGWLEVRQPMPEAGWEVRILANMSEVYSSVFRSILVATLMFAFTVMAILFWLERRRAIADREAYQIAAQRQAEANEAHVRAIIDNTNAGLITVDASGCIESFNPCAEGLFDTTSELACGQPFTAFLAERGGQACTAQLQRLAERDRPMECEGRRASGSQFPIELTALAIATDHRARYILTVHDLTERKQHELALRQAHDRLEERVLERTQDLNITNRRLREEVDERLRAEENLRQTQAELIQAAKLAGLGQMSAGISHELNQPLAAIRTYADNARALLQQGRDEKAHWNLEQISELTVRMAKIITQLKTFARKGDTEMTRVSLLAILDRALELLAMRIEQSGTVISVQVAEEIEVIAEPVQLEQILVNLFTNAIQAMEDVAPKRLSIVATADGEYVDIRVRDSGPGIEQQHAEHIFDPFFTTKEVGQGLGLGLSISYRIVEGFGGQLRARNHPDGGAEFSVILREVPMSKAVPHAV